MVFWFVNGRSKNFYIKNKQISAIATIAMIIVIGFAIKSFKTSFKAFHKILKISLKGQMIMARSFSAQFLSFLLSCFSFFFILLLYTKFAWL